MNGLIQKLLADQEIQELKKRCHELTGKWIPYHWDCFKDFDDYKNHMRQVIAEHENTTSQKG